MKIRKLLRYSLITLTTWFLVHLIILLAVGLSNGASKADAILIFGNKVEVSGQPSERLKSRLDEGLELFENNLAPLIIVSGGFGKEGFDEALVMKEYLMANNVPESVIITDQNGNTTYLTAKNIIKLKESHNIQSVIVVSQYYHILRAKMAVRRSDFSPVYSSYAKMFPELRDLYSIPREIAGYYVYLFKG